MIKRYKERHDEIVEICKTALTLTEVEARLGGTTPNTTLRLYIKQSKIPMPMYEGGKVACRISQRSRQKITDSDLCENSTASRSSIRRYLIRTGYKKEECEKCGWHESRETDGKIPVHLHHKNGDGSDHRPKNLEMLCPNCHSLTPNYAGKNQQNPGRSREAAARKLYYSAPKHICEVCGKLGYGVKFCSPKCSHDATRKVDWPSKEVLEEEIKILSWVALGRKYGVSDNAVRKWARHYEVAAA